MSIRRPSVAAAVLASALCAAPALSQAAAAGQDPTAGRARAYTVTASVSKADPLRGKKVTVKGTVRPAAPGRRVVLQRQNLGGGANWKTIDRTRLSNASSYRFRFTVRAARERAYRVVKLTEGHRPEDRSPVVTVTGYEWTPFFLNSSYVGLDPTLSYFADSSIGGHSFATSFESAMTPFSGWTNTTRRCKTFRVTVGLVDPAPTDGRANFSLTADGVERFSGSYGAGESDEVVVDVTGVFRIAIDGTTENGGVAGIAQPHGLCTRPHR